MRRSGSGGRGFFWLVAFAVLVALALSFVPTAHAQEAGGLVIEQLQVDLWPQYDDPRLLVIYKGELAVPPSRPLRFPIPAGAEVNAVARVDEEGRLITELWDSQVVGEQQIVTFTPKTAGFQIEYYIDVIKPGPEKSFTVEIDVDGQQVNVLGITVQQPAGATNLKGEPALSGPVAGRFGLSYYARRIEGVQSGQVVQQTVSYTKPDDTLSVEQIRPAMTKSVSSAPTGTSAPTPPAFSTNLSRRSVRAFWLPVGATVVIVAGLVLIGVGAWRARQGEPLSRGEVLEGRRAPGKVASRRRGRQRSRRAPGRVDVAVQTRGGPAKFCHGCGAAFEPEDRFCAECGTPRRGLSE